MEAKKYTRIVNYISLCEAIPLPKFYLLPLAVNMADAVTGDHVSGRIGGDDEGSEGEKRDGGAERVTSSAELGEEQSEVTKVLVF